MYSETKPKRKREEIPTLGGMLGAMGGGVWRFSQRAISRVLHWTWLAVKWSAIGSWRAVVWLTLFTWKGAGWALGLPGRMLGGVVRWWRGPEPYFESERERDIYQRIRRQFRRRNRFLLHTFTYLALNSAFWIQWYNMSRGAYPPSLWNYLALSVVTSLFLLFHFLQMRSAVAEENALETALNRERYYADQYDSLRYTRLSDDGEIVDDYYVDETEAKRKRR